MRISAMQQKTGIWYIYVLDTNSMKANEVAEFKGEKTMTATVLHRRVGERSLSTRVWAFLTAFLAKIAESDARTQKKEPFGL
jgi:hypothetical protein